MAKSLEYVTEPSKDLILYHRSRGTTGFSAWKKVTSTNL